MRIALVENESVANVAVAESVLPGWTECPDDVSPGWSYIDGTWTAPTPIDPPKQTVLSHRDFILRLGADHAAIHRLKDENNALPPDQKNYELARLFALWDAAQEIRLDDPDMIAAFDAFVSMGIVTQARADEILGA